jgi:hypothetical protein
MLQGSKPAVIQKSAELRITSKKLETKLLSSDKISSSEIKRLRNEYLEISPYLPTCCTPDVQKGGSFRKALKYLF